MASRQFLTDEQWEVLSPLILPPKRRPDGRARSIEHNDRAVLDGVLWILCTSAAWADLPDRYPSYSSCFRRFSQRVKDGTLRHVLEALALDLQARGEIDLLECFIDGTFVVAKKGA